MFLVVTASSVTLTNSLLPSSLNLILYRAMSLITCLTDVQKIQSKVTEMVTDNIY